MIILTVFIGEPGLLEPPNKEHLQNFFHVPSQIESIILLGVFICLDAFLYVLTYLPIRVILSFYLLLVEIHCMILPNIFYLNSNDSSNSKNNSSGSSNNSNNSIGNCSSINNNNNIIINDNDDNKNNMKSKYTFHRTHIYDLMRGMMFIIGCLSLSYINMSQVYHFIRGQGMIKLYVLTAMLEICDKLLSSFGQDAFDSLHSVTRNNPKSIELFLTFIMVTIYICIHSINYFFLIATITVVINSDDKALLTVLILNNFTEMKTYVLKKYDCHHLFQLTCSDIVERFQMFLFLFLILIIQLSQSNIILWYDTLLSFLKIAMFMLIAECFADWMKHAFINKFNFINATVYEDFAYVLRNDILSNQKDQIILDHTYSVTRRLGLSQV